MNLSDLQPLLDAIPKAIVYCTGVVGLLVPFAKKLRKLASILKKNLGVDPLEKSFV